MAAGVVARVGEGTCSDLQRLQLPGQRHDGFFIQRWRSTSRLCRSVCKPTSMPDVELGAGKTWRPTHAVQVLRELLLYPHLAHDGCSVVPLSVVDVKLHARRKKQVPSHGKGRLVLHCFALGVVERSSRQLRWQQQLVTPQHRRRAHRRIEVEYSAPAHVIKVPQWIDGSGTCSRPGATAQSRPGTHEASHVEFLMRTVRLRGPLQYAKHQRRRALRWKTNQILFDGCRAANTSSLLQQ